MRSTSFLNIALKTMLLLGNWRVALLTYLASVARSVAKQPVRAPCSSVHCLHRFMSVNTAIEQLLEIEERRQEDAYNGDTMCVGLARVGAAEQTVVAGPMRSLLDVNFGPPLHSLVIAGDLHPIEQEMLHLLRQA